MGLVLSLKVGSGATEAKWFDLDYVAGATSLSRVPYVCICFIPNQDYFVPVRSHHQHTYHQHFPIVRVDYYDDNDEGVLLVPAALLLLGVPPPFLLLLLLWSLGVNGVVAVLLLMLLLFKFDDNDDCLRSCTNSAFNCSFSRFNPSTSTFGGAPM
jgi:hypothetical protein